MVNSLSTQGQLPLGLALIGGSKTIADTLVDNGKAKVNAVNGEVRRFTFKLRDEITNF